jgi:hypothetical protein
MSLPWSVFAYIWEFSKPFYIQTIKQSGKIEWWIRKPVTVQRQLLVLNSTNSGRIYDKFYNDMFFIEYCYLCGRSTIHEHCEHSIEAIRM